MIDVNKYQAKFEERCLAAGLTKLNKPVDTEEFVFYATEVQDNDNFYATEVQDNDNFDVLFFEPMMKSLIRTIAEEENHEFYRLDVSCVGNMIIFTSSRGDNSVQQALSQFVE